MQSNLITVLVFVCVGILVTNLVTIITLFLLKRKSKDNKVISDEKYLDLNIKFQYLITILIMGGFLLAFIGWNTKSQIIKELKGEILIDTKQQIDAISIAGDSLELKFTKLGQLQKKQREKINELNSQNDNLQSKLVDISASIEKKDEFIKTLLHIYIVTDVDLHFEKNVARLYYKDLRPINARKLPEFKEPPIVNIQTKSGLVFNIQSNTKNYIEISPIAGDGGPFLLTFWIVER